MWRLRSWPESALGEIADLIGKKGRRRLHHSVEPGAGGEVKRTKRMTVPCLFPLELSLASPPFTFTVALPPRV
jgi:hypothetical protein